MENLKEALELRKAKYIKRTGSPGRYKYVYYQSKGKKSVPKDQKRRSAVGKVQQLPLEGIGGVMPSIPNLDKIKKMDKKELRQYVSNSFGSRFSGITKGNRDAANIVVYQMQVVKALGLKSRKKFVVKFEDKELSRKNVYGQYAPDAATIRISSAHTESFVHEYFHLLYYTRGLSKTKNMARLVDQIKSTHVYRTYFLMDRDRQAQGKEKYWTKPTEMIARLGESAVVRSLAPKEMELVPKKVDSRVLFSKEDIEKLKPLLLKLFRKGEAIIKSAITFFSGGK